VVPRAQDALELAADARAAGLAGLVLKDHCCATTALATTLNRLYPDGPRFFGAITLNLPIGGLNPFAVEAALRAGAAIVWLPTYTAAFHVARSPQSFAAAYPRPKRGYGGIRLLDEAGALLPEMRVIMALVAAFDAVLATGHVAPEESLAAAHAAQAIGVRRLVITHATATLSLAQQREAVACGALIEHCLQATAPLGAGPVSMATVRDQARAVGVEHVVISSDFGQVGNGPIVAAYAAHLGALSRAGLADEEIRAMIAENPRRLLADRASHVDA
jgi:hypothetical protein